MKTKNEIVNWLINNTFTTAIFLLIMGFILMTLVNLDSSRVNSILSLTVSPIVLLAGYSLIIFAIMKRPVK